MNLLTRAVSFVPPSVLDWAVHFQAKSPPFRWLYLRAGRLVKNRDGRIARGLGAGLRFNIGGSNASYLTGTCEAALQAALGMLVNPGMKVWDIGANVGYVSCLAARLVGPSGRVIAFEPLAENACVAGHNLAMNGFGWAEIRAEAVGSTDGEADFRRHEGGSAMGQLASVGWHLSEDAPTERVRVRSIDSLVAELGTPGLIKIDVEGAEAQVLAGARETLPHVGPTLIIELHDTNAAVADLLDAAGYQSIVIGSHASVRKAPWYAMVVAVPAARVELMLALSALQHHEGMR